MSGKIESQVIENSDLLEKEIKKYIKSHKNQYIVFHQSQSHFADTLESGVETGIKEFGEKVGFVVKKVTSQPAIFSALIGSQ